MRLKLDPLLLYYTKRIDSFIRAVTKYNHIKDYTGLIFIIRKISKHLYIRKTKFVIGEPNHSEYVKTAIRLIIQG